VFCYTSWRFNAFSRTNLLTRCHSASSLFTAVFVFQKIYTGNILGIERNKSRTSYFYGSFAKTEDETEGARGQPHHQGARPSPWSRPPMVRPLGPTSDAAPSPIKSPRREKPRTDLFSTKHTTSRCRRKIGRVQELFPAPCRRPSTPPWSPPE
jgi:hypothetical protein